jgi:hypothetical protein
LDRGGYYSGENGDNIAAYNDDNSDIYTIASSANTGFVFDISDGSINNGTNVGIMSANGGANQRFRINRSGAVSIINAVHSGKSLDVDGWSTRPGTNVQQWQSNSGTAQNWLFYDAGNGYVYIKSELGSVYLTVDGTEAGSNVNIQEFAGTENQKFKLIKNN